MGTIDSVARVAYDLTLAERTCEEHLTIATADLRALLDERDALQKKLAEERWATASALTTATTFAADAVTVAVTLEKLHADLAALRKAATAYIAAQWDMDELRREGAEGGKLFAAANRAQCEAIEAISKLLSQPSE